jgi:hypothetical protein
MMVNGGANYFEFVDIVLKIPYPKHHEIQDFGQNSKISYKAQPCSMCIMLSVLK